jgi:hypothetical protein
MIKFEFASWIAFGGGFCQLLLCALFPSPNDLVRIYIAALCFAVGVAGLVLSYFNRETDWDME